METPRKQSSPRHTDAEEALRAARREESATKNRPVPWWYYPALAALAFGLCAINAISVATTSAKVVTAVTALFAAVLAGFLVGKFSLFPSGYRSIRVDWRPAAAYALAAMAFPVTALLTAGALGSWVWIASGAAVGLFILVPGLIYWNTSRRA